MDHVPPFVLALIDRLIDREGGLSNVSGDRGGFTNAGITLPTLSRYLGRQATIEELAKLDHDTAVNIYFTLFWLGIRIYRAYAVSASIGEQMLDWSVNSGPEAAIHLQRFLGVKEDGNIGDQTINVLKEALERDRDLDGKFLDYRAHYVAGICVHDASQLKFLQGWLNRIFALRYRSTLPLETPAVARQ